MLEKTAWALQLSILHSLQVIFELARGMFTFIFWNDWQYLGGTQLLKTWMLPKSCRLIEVVFPYVYYSNENFNANF